MDQQQLKNIIEAALLAAGGSLSLDQMLLLFDESALPEKKALREVLAMLAEDYQNRGMQLIETGSGWRIQVRPLVCISATVRFRVSGSWVVRSMVTP